jgi:hypothetical protein
MRTGFDSEFGELIFTQIDGIESIIFEGCDRGDILIINAF